jgi:hypothetical protein
MSTVPYQHKDGDDTKTISYTSAKFTYAESKFAIGRAGMPGCGIDAREIWDIDEGQLFARTT